MKELRSSNASRKIAWVSIFWGFVLVFVFTTKGMAANEKIVVLAFEYPPIYQNDKDKGLSGDLVVAAFKAVNLDVDMQFSRLPGWSIWSAMVRPFAGSEERYCSPLQRLPQTSRFLRKYNLCRRRFFMTPENIQTE